MKAQPEVIIFDLFGTLVRYGVQLHLYRQLLKWARENGRRPHANDARILMTLNADIVQTAEHMGIKPPIELLRRLVNDIEAELQSLTLFDDVVPTLDALQKSGTRLAICSNLAKPYGAVIDRLLSNYDTKNYLSYECGFIKPEPQIYQLIIEDFQVEAKQCLFVGDTALADYDGPREAGMSAYHLVRDKEVSTGSIACLTDLLNQYNRN